MWNIFVILKRSPQWGTSYCRNKILNIELNKTFVGNPLKNDNHK